MRKQNSALTPRSQVIINRLPLPTKEKPTIFMKNMLIVDILSPPSIKIAEKI
jgi:hypothetical protein